MTHDELREDLIDETGMTVVGANKLIDELMPHIDAYVTEQVAAERARIAAAIRAKYPMPGADGFTWSAALVYSVGENCAHIALAGGVR